MSKKKIISVSYSNNGIPYIKKQKDAYITFKLNNKNEVVIIGNRIGLRLLAKSALGLAEMDNESDYHIHIDDLYNINEEGKSFVICSNDNN